eukprot:9332121-Pyramimonas_sp.AAC.1
MEGSPLGSARGQFQLPPLTDGMFNSWRTRSIRSWFVLLISCLVIVRLAGKSAAASRIVFSIFASPSCVA